MFEAKLVVESVGAVELAFSKLAVIGIGVGATRAFTPLSPPPDKEKYSILENNKKIEQ